MKNDLITDKNVFCKFISNDGILFSKANYISMNQKKNITCEIQKSTFSNLIEIIDISLFMNSSEVLFFDLSKNNQSYLFIKDNIEWKSQKVIDSNSLSTEMNFFVPLRIDFKYSLEISSDHMNSTSNLVLCDFSIGMNSKCNLPKSYLETIKTIPSKLIFNLKVIHKYSMKSFSVNVNELIYFHLTEFEHLKPHFISYNERLNYPLRLIGNTLLNLDSKNYQFICNISQNGTKNFISVNATFDIQSIEYQSDLNKSSHFSCTFNSFGLKNVDYKLTLSFISIEGIKRVTKNESTIFVFEKGFELETFYGSNLGGYQIGRINYKNEFPTFIYSNYKFSLKFEDRNEEILIPNSEFSEGGFSFTMIDISKFYKSWNIIERRMKLNLYINSIKSIGFYPYFTFYQITIDSILPSNFIKLKTKSLLFFKIKEKFNQKLNIDVKYVNEFNEIQQEKCKMKLENFIECLSPSYDKLSDVSIFFSINRGSDYNGGKMLKIYDEKKITFLNIEPKFVSSYKNSNITITGLFIGNSTNILIRYSNYRGIKEITKGFLLNETTIITNSPSFYLTNINSISMNVGIDISFDNGNFYEKTNFSIELSSLGKKKKKIFLIFFFIFRCYSLFTFNFT